MSQGTSRVVVIVLWSVPLGVAALMVGANVALAGVLARLFAFVGWAPVAGVSGLGFWAAFFGALALANLPALAVVGAWVRAEEEERATRAEVLGALRWSSRLDRWQPQLWPGVPAPVVATSSGLLPARTHPALRRHLPYLGRFACALAVPVALLGVLANA